MKCPHCGKEVETYDVLDIFEDEDGNELKMCASHGPTYSHPMIDHSPWWISLVAIAVAVIVALVVML